MFVRELPIRAIQKLSLALDDEAAMAELYADQPEGWDDTLTVASHNAIIETGGALNFPLLEGWMERKGALVAKLTPAVQKITGGRNLSPA